MISYNLTTAAIGLLAAFAIIRLVRRSILYTRYSVWWMGVAASLVLFGLFPRLSDAMAGYLGVAYPPTLIFAAALAVLFVKILLMDIDRSKQEVRIRRLIQRNAILQARLIEQGALPADSTDIGRQDAAPVRGGAAGREEGGA